MDFFWVMMIYWVLLIGLVAFAAYYITRKWYYGHNSAAGKKLVARTLRSHGTIRGWKCFDNVTLGTDAEAVTVDHIVAGPFGLIVACDLHQKGSVYGALQDERWVLTQGEEGKEKKRERIENPYRRAQQGTEQLRRLLAAGKVYSVPVEILIPKTMKQNSFVTGGNEVIFSRSQLKKQLGRSRYEKDNGVDVEKIAQLLTGHL